MGKFLGFDEIWVDDIISNDIEVGDKVMIMTDHYVDFDSHFGHNNFVLAHYNFGDCIFEVIKYNDDGNGVNLCSIGNKKYDFIEGYWYDINSLVKLRYE